MVFYFITFRELRMINQDLLNKKLEEATEAEQLRFLHEIGEQIWRPKDSETFDYSTTYQQLKAKLLPKQYSAQYRTAIGNWHNTVKSWLDEILTEVLREVFTELWKEHSENYEVVVENLINLSFV